MDARLYCDADIFERERSAIFQRSWQLVCLHDAVAAPGACLPVTIGGAALILLRGDDGILRAFRNACPHRGARLVEETRDCVDELQCPYHGWKFDTRGSLTDMPWFGQPSPLDPALYPLSKVGIAEWRGLIFVAIDPIEPLERQLGDLPDLLEPVPLENMATLGRSTFAADVNWKCYFDQFTENYHVPIVHAPDKSVEIWNYTVMTGDNTVTLAAPGDGMHFGGRWVWIWPSCTFSTFPGGAKLSRIEPTGPMSFGIHYQYLFERSAPLDENARQRVIQSTEAIFRDDVMACKLVQGNYASGSFQSGPLRADLENGTAYFQSRILDALGMAR
ncbi:aromatic ring-hydroxylating dioxygenase subunit alpha [Sphingobium sp. JS3065]|uniref:aromatic ring-hydroxylating oxygenase subunit alpha n=1 Tax=Sphingobium sp. JS3065 TaxID=2970925 RepID=UPI002264A68C|nr:aromatic ring-hydroxylating dioxygenase subunit alpha [Sphingobium sp. JS3065]UZW57528.1 aromatic ring-hydroxylating dioxygenase subunit alpha [Sphingobium sp. JS3065]